ncbi:MAG: fasciclin domain-containing protein, partial [Sphingomonadaceae bacterium]
HVVPGWLMAADVARAIQAGGGSATVTTVQGGRLTARVENGAVVLTDAKGGKARGTATSLSAGNGLVPVVDPFVRPEAGRGRAAAMVLLAPAATGATASA